MAELLDIAAPLSENTNLLDISDDATTADLTPSEALATGEKYDYAMGELSPGSREISLALMQGSEASLRERLALSADIDDRLRREQQVRNYFSNFHTGEEITQEDVDYANAMISEHRVPPEFVVERQMGKQVFRDLDETSGGGVSRDLDNDDPAVAAGAELNTERTFGIKMSLDRVAKEYFKKYEKISTWEGFLGGTELLIPFLAQYRQSGLIKNDPNEDGSWWFGTNLEDQISDFWSSETPEIADAKLKEAMEYLWATNPTNAMMFLQTLMNGTSGDFAHMNAMTAIDASFPLPFVGSIPYKGAYRLSKGTADVMRAVGSGKFSKVKVADAVGKAETEFVLAKQKLLDKINGSALRPQSFEEIEHILPAAWNPEAVVGGSYSYLTREPARRLYLEMIRSNTKLIDGLLNSPAKIDRLTSDPAFREAMTSAEELWNLQLPHLENQLMDVRLNKRPEDTGQGVYVAEALFGDSKAKRFPTFEAAETEAKYNGLIGYDIKPEGGGFAISLKKVAPETDARVRDQLIWGTMNEPPATPINLFFKYFKGHETLIDPQTAQDIKVAEFGTSGLLRLMAQESQPLASLNKGSRQALSSFLQRERVAPTGTPGEVGKTSNTLGEFESNWLEMHSRLPTDAETSAYFTFTRINNYDLILRNMGILRDKQRAGIENFSFSFRYKDENDNTIRATAKEIEGKTVSEIPWGNREKEDAGILVLDTDLEVAFPLVTDVRGVPGNVQRTREGNYFRMRDTPQRAFTEQILEQQGDFRIIQLTELGEDQLRALPGMDKVVPRGKIDFLLVREARPTPMRFWQVPHRPGFHLQYPLSGYMVKQPRIHQRGDLDPHWTYYGDKSFFYQASGKDATRLTKDLEAARLGLDDLDAGRITESEFYNTYLKNKIPEHDVSRFKRLFPNEEARRTPFYSVRMGENTYDAHKIVDKYPLGKISKRSDSIYNLYKGFDLEYTMKRDMPLNSVVNEGTSTNPIYKLAAADMLEPIHTLERATGGSVRGLYLDDLKIKMAEKFVQRFHPLMKTHVDEMRQDPIRHLLNPQWRDVSEVDRVALAAGQNYALVAREFLAVKNDYDKALNLIQHKLVQSMYDGKQPGPVGRWFISKLESPPSFFRQLAFDAYIGLFNPTQFFKQLNTMAHVSGITNPYQAAKGLHAGLYMRSLLMAPDAEKLEHAAAKAAKLFGWKKEHFKESFENLRRSQFWVVGREASYWDNYVGGNLIQGPVGKFLHWGRAPFRMGDQIPRLTAWNVAYNEWRTANPTAKFGDNALAKVLHRSNTLTARMDAASNAQMQKGYAGVFTQFFSWQLRIAEDFLGKRLTPKEKAKLGATYATLYGIPVAAAAPIAFWPVKESLRQWELDNPDVVTNDPNILMRMAVDGVPSAMIEGLIGERYDLSVFGPSGLPFLKDLYEGDKETTEFLGGAAGSLLHDTFFAMHPLVMMIADTITGPEDTYQINAKDFLSLVKPIASIGAADRLYMGIAYGTRVTKSGEVIDEVSAGEALAQLGTGVQPQRVVDTFLKINNIQANKKWNEKVGKEYIKHMRAGFQQHSDGNWEEGLNSFKKAARTLDWAPNMDLNEKRRWLARASKGYEKMIDSVGQRYANTPERLEAWVNELKKRSD